MTQRCGQEGVASAPAAVTHAEWERHGKEARQAPCVSRLSPPCHSGAWRAFYPEGFVFRKQVFSRCFSKVSRPSHSERSRVGEKVTDSKAIPARCSG